MDRATAASVSEHTLAACFKQDETFCPCSRRTVPFLSWSPAPLFVVQGRSSFKRRKRR